MTAIVGFAHMFGQSSCPKIQHTYGNHQHGCAGDADDARDYIGPADSLASLLTHAQR